MFEYFGESQISVSLLLTASQIMISFQIQQWGNVDWYHDLDVQELQCRLAAAVLFVHWTSETQTIKKKASIADFV